MEKTIAVGIKDLKVCCIIGCLPEERKTPQTILMDITMRLLLPTVDSISETVDYTVLATLAEEIATQGKYALLETLAHALITGLAKKYPQIQKLSLLIKKERALENAAYTFVELEL
jgi:dihydroneopterin aldolase